MNQFEADARAKKVDALVTMIWNVLTPENRIDPETVTVLRRLQQGGWDMLAEEAGVRSPSERTQRVVVHTITQRVRDARWGFHQGKAVA